MDVVFSIMKFFMPTERHAEAVQMLQAIQSRLQISTGHLGSWLQERDHPCPYILYEEQWKSKEAVYAHIRSSLYRRLLAVMEFSSRAPEVSFFFVSHTKGMELIEELRLESQAALTVT